MIENKVLDIKRLKINLLKNNRNIEFETMTISKGDLVLLSGRNGSGKSTFLHFLMLNFKGLSKEIYFNTSIDTEVYLKGSIKTINKFTEREIDEYRKSIISMDQNDSFYYGKNIQYNLINSTLSALPGSLTNKEKLDIKKTALKKLEEYHDKYYEILHFNPNFKAFCRSYTDNLSGGQRKFLKVFQSLIKLEVLKDQISLLLLDEPLNNLDREKKMVFNNLIQKAREVHPDLVIIFISHCRSIRAVTKEIQFEDQSVKLIENQSYCNLDFSILDKDQKKYEEIFRSHS